MKRVYNGTACDQRKAVYIRSLPLQWAVEATKTELARQRDPPPPAPPPPLG